MRMVGKFLVIFATIASISSARQIWRTDVLNSVVETEENLIIEPRIFEANILEAIEKLKEFLKKGDTSSGIIPLDPFFFPYQGFDLIINDTKLAGFFQNVSIAGFSDFETKKVEFNVFPLLFKIEILLTDTFINGRYKLSGRIFDEMPVNGTGKFRSETKNMNLSFYIKPNIVDSFFQIQDLVLNYKIAEEKVNYTNEYESEEFKVLNETIVLSVLDRVQEKYLPALLNTGKMVVNHFLLGYTYLELLEILINLFQKH